MAKTQLNSVLGHLERVAAIGQASGSSDGELLRRFIDRRDEAAFAALVRRHAALVHGVCRQVLGQEQDAEDAFQATFLALAQGAASVRQAESLASWLHGVAYRMSLRAKRDAARRRTHERRATPPERQDPTAEVTWREVQAALHEEVQRLPKKYRDSFVLHCLEEKNCQEVAHALGLKEGTVWSRLAQARKTLQRRLARRGLKLAMLLAAVEVTTQTSAGAPPLLVSTTIRAAFQLAAGGQAAGPASAGALSLATGVLQTMMPSKLKVVIAAVLAAGAVAIGATLLAHPSSAQEGVARKQESRTPAKVRAPDGPPATGKAGPADDRFEVEGRVADPAGKPVGGAKLYLLDYPARVGPVKERAATAEDGRFRFGLARADVGLWEPHNWISPWESIVVLAAARGYGPAMVPARKAGGGLTLRLAADDVPVNGQIVDLEGRPLGGVTVRVRELWFPERDLTAWLEARKKHRTVNEGQFFRMVTCPGLASFFPPAVTDKAGRFRIKGLGRERVAILTFEGPTIESHRVGVMTRPGKAVTLPDWERRLRPEEREATFVCYGARFDHPAAPCRPVEGVVRARDTGKPLAGVTVAGRRSRTITDKAGRYRLLGLPRTGGQVVAFGAEGQPYVASARKVTSRPGAEAFTLDFDLEPGVRITGRLTDRSTGRPVAGQVYYFASLDNPNNKAGTLPEVVRTVGEDGSFDLVVLPGRGIVAARAWGYRYLVSLGAENIKIKSIFEGKLFETQPYFCQHFMYNRLAEVNPAAGARPLKVDLEVDTGRTVSGEVVGPDGKPLTGALAFGLRFNEHGPFWEPGPQESARFTAYGLRRGKPRKILFIHQAKRLAGALVTEGAEKGPVVVKLQPWAVVSGRLVDAKGQPRVGVALGIHYGGSTGPDLLGSLQGDFQTGKDGRFRIEGLIPGFKYALPVVLQAEGGRVFRDLTFKAGETRPLGDVRAAPGK